MVYLSDYVGGNLIDSDFTCELVLVVPHREIDYQSLLLLLVDARSYLSADVLGIEVIVYLLESYQQIVILIAGIYPLGDGINFDIVLPKVVNEQGSLRSVSAQSAQVLDEYQLDYSFVNCIFKLLKTFPVERHS